MDIGKSLSFVFEDKRWLEKTLVGGLVFLGTIVLSWTVIGLFVGIGLLYGYMIEVVRNVRRGEPYPLPEWSNWGDKIVLGLKYLVVYLVWSLPLLIVWIPFVILSALAGSASSDTATGIIGVASFCVGCLALLYGLVLLLASPGITIRFAERGDISDGLAVSSILAFTREHIGDVLIAIIMLLVVSTLASIVGTILCGVGLFFTTFWATVVQGHLFAQVGLGKATGLVSTSGPRHDLSPEDVMPGVGELPSGEEKPSV
jgi:hypothetical protein